jgi:DNA-binding transcriptional ArsR family regulator
VKNFVSKADKIASFLRLLATDKRLLVFANLSASREMSANDLAHSVDISQSALSQHLAELWQEWLVSTRRVPGQSITAWLRTLATASVGASIIAAHRKLVDKLL